jgi:hypothetical protein
MVAPTMPGTAATVSEHDRAVAVAFAKKVSALQRRTFVKPR